MYFFHTPQCGSVEKIYPQQNEYLGLLQNEKQKNRRWGRTNVYFWKYGHLHGDKKVYLSGGLTEDKPKEACP